MALPAFTLWWRELVRFYRQRSRVIGVIASPLVFWVVLGSGFGTSFRAGSAPGQQHYLDYFYPGALIMIVLFTSIFTMMSVIEDRKEGFLLSVLVAPVPRSAIVLGKVLGGTTLAAVQGLIFLLLGSSAGVHISLASVAAHRPDGLAGFLLADRPGFRDRLAHGLDRGVPCNHQSVPDSAVALVRRYVPAIWRLRLAAGSDADQPADLRGGSAAHTALSKYPGRIFARLGDGHAGAVFAVYVWAGVRGGESPEHETGSVRCRR